MGCVASQHKVQSRKRHRSRTSTSSSDGQPLAKKHNRLAHTKNDLYGLNKEETSQPEVYDNALGTLNEEDEETEDVFPVMSRGSETDERVTDSDREPTPPPPENQGRRRSSILRLPVSIIDGGYLYGLASGYRINHNHDSDYEQDENIGDDVDGDNDEYGNDPGYDADHEYGDDDEYYDEDEYYDGDEYYDDEEFSYGEEEFDEEGHPIIRCQHVGRNGRILHLPEECDISCTPLFRPKKICCSCGSGSNCSDDDDVLKWEQRRLDEMDDMDNYRGLPLH